MVPFFRSLIRQTAISVATTAVLAASSLALARGPASPPAFDHPALVNDTASRPTISSETPFLSENESAMNKMMADMSVKPTGDVDRDFVAMMVPHHRGAVAMAQAELRYGHNEQLRRLAQEIVVNQQQGIATMRLAIGQPFPPSVASPIQPSPSPAPEIGQHSMPHGAMNMSPASISKTSIR